MSDLFDSPVITLILRKIALNTVMKASQVCCFVSFFKGSHFAHLLVTLRSNKSVTFTQFQLHWRVPFTHWFVTKFPISFFIHRNYNSQKDFFSLFQSNYQVLVHYFYQFALGRAFYFKVLGILIYNTYDSTKLRAFEIND